MGQLLKPTVQNRSQSDMDSGKLSLPLDSSLASVSLSSVLSLLNDKCHTS